ncbi:MAG: hypothetical protein ACTSO9_12500 [Candidatus Helarchaeota archaeon]
MIFIVIIALITINELLFLAIRFTGYPWTALLTFGIIFGLGIFAYLLLAIGSFKDSSSDRLEQSHRTGLILVGIFSIGIAVGILLISWGLYYALPYVAFPVPPQISAFWLIWLCLVDIIFLFMVRGAVKLIT